MDAVEIVSRIEGLLVQGEQRLERFLSLSDSGASTQSKAAQAAHLRLIMRSLEGTAEIYRQIAIGQTVVKQVQRSRAV